MNEITRIHIAKTPYDIEIAAKKQLDEYLKKLEAYSGDDELLLDIEIRIVELLAERRVSANGVISSDDIKAIRDQLGEPYEFADGENDKAAVESGETVRPKLYRNMDDAMLGGVLSGVASYTGINSIWVRLIFVVLMFVSFGFAAFVYGLFWIIVPPAKTAAEKLQSIGKPVNLSSMRQLNETEDLGRSTKTPVLQRVLSVSAGLLSLLAAVGITFAVIFMVIVTLGSNGVVEMSKDVIGEVPVNEALAWLLFWLVMFGLTMLVSLFSILSYALLARKFTKPIIIAAAIVTVLGIASATTVASVTARESFRVREEIQSSVQEEEIDLPQVFSNVKNVVIEDGTKFGRDSEVFWGNASIQYIVSDREPRYTLVGLPELKANIRTEGSTAYVSISNLDSIRSNLVGSRLAIYGPALDSLTSNTASEVRYIASEQEALTISGKSESNISVTGSFTSVSVDGEGSVQLGESAIQTLSINSGQQLSLSAGTVKSLNVEFPDSCVDNDYGDRSVEVSINAVSSGVMKYNGNEIAADSKQSECASLTIGDEQYNGEYFVE